MFFTIHVYGHSLVCVENSSRTPVVPTHRHANPLYKTAVTQSFLCNRSFPTLRVNQPWIHHWLNSWVGNSQIQKADCSFLI